jgi:hypothetical protein
MKKTFKGKLKGETTKTSWRSFQKMRVKEIKPFRYISHLPYTFSQNKKMNKLNEKSNTSPCKRWTKSQSQKQKVKLIIVRENINKS